MKALIIDSQSTSIKIPKLFAKAIEIIGIAQSEFFAIKLIDIYQPQFIFANADMDNDICFRILDKLAYSKLPIVFVSQSTQKALQAVKYAPIDYLISPIKEDEFTLFLERINNKLIYEI